VDDEGLERECGELARVIRTHRRPELGKRWRCPKELRERAVAYAEACCGRGESKWAVAQRLGVVESTLCRWLRRKRGAIVPAMRPVSVVGALSREHADEPSPTPRLRLVTPNGYVVDGLDLEEVAYLLRILP
jgi:transposase-like protein